MMRFQRWRSIGVVLGLLMVVPFAGAQSAPAAEQPTAVASDQLPNECVDAGLDTKQECDSFLKKAGPKSHKPAAPARETDPAAATPAQDKPTTHLKGGNKDAGGEPTVVPEPAVVPDNQPADATPTDQGNQKPKRLRLPPDCVAAGVTTAEECKALRANGGNEPQKGGAKNQKKPVLEEPAAIAPTENSAPAGNANPAQKETSKKPGNAPVVNQAPADNGVPITNDSNQKPHHVKIAKDCFAAGLKTQEECDAFHAKGAGAAAPAVNDAPAKAPPDINQPSPPENGRTQPEKTARLSKDCIEAGLKTQGECDALHAINSQNRKDKSPASADQTSAPRAPDSTTPSVGTPAKPKPTQTEDIQPAATAPVALPDITGGLKSAAKSYNGAAAALSRAGQDKAAADKARADLKQARATIDQLCKSNKFDTTAQCLAQYGVQLAQVPASESPNGEAVAATPVQPVEVIATLPKGVTKDEVAPLLDSAKEQKQGKGEAGHTPPQGRLATEIPNNPPPANDKSAQVDIKPAKIVPIDEQKGQQIDPKATAQAQVPKNVTIINQTVVNNTTINTTSDTSTQVNVDRERRQPSGNNPDRSGIGSRRDNGGSSGSDQATNPIGLSIGLVVQLGNQLIISSPGRDQHRMADRDRDRTNYERLPRDRYRETITRPDGVRIVTIYNRNGDVLRRSRFDRDGQETVLAYFDDSHEQDLLQWRDPGDDLPPLRLSIPARDYVLDADQADEGQVEQFFSQPPVEQVRRLYSINEIKRSARIRDMVRRLEIGDLTFDTGSASISQDQVRTLSNVANAMLQLLQQNPAETFLIEGHTDAVGSDISNLQLSDERAATVAGILTDYYQIQPENLTTQGYGAHYLKVQTDGPERLNRRVTIRRITSLVTLATGRQ
jgi:outer membrane protein OmpA-like peptidoglycan-associated protein